MSRTTRQDDALSAGENPAHGPRPCTAVPGSSDQPIRVLSVITGLASGGATNVVLDLAGHFSHQPGFTQDLVTGPSPPGRTDQTHLAYELGINTRVVPSLVNHIRPAANLRAVAQLRRIMVEGCYDIVHTHSSVAGVVGRLAARWAGVPVVIHHVHGWALHDEMSLAMRTLYVGLERLCAKYTTQLVMVSRPDIPKGLSHRIGREEQYRLIYNGIDLEKFQQPVNEQEVRAQLGLQPHSKLVGMIGRLDRQKNPLDLIRTAALVTARIPDVQFLIVGDGVLRPQCEQLIGELNLQGKVHLLGFRSDVARILPILNVTAMSSLWEGLPIAFLEAMSAGKPIVANNVDGASDVVVNGTTGFLVTPQRPAEMAERIVSLLRDEALCREMGRVAREQSLYFSKQRMLQEVEHLYRKLHAAARASQQRAFERKPAAGFPRRRMLAVPASSQAHPGC